MQKNGRFMPEMALFGSFADREVILGCRGGCISYCEFYMPLEIYERGFCYSQNMAIFKHTLKP